MSKWEIGVYSSNQIPTVNYDEKNELSIHMEHDDLEQRYYYFDAKCLNYITPDDSPEDIIPIIEGVTLIANGAIVLRTKNVQKALEINWNQIFYDEQRISIYKRDFQPSMNPFSIITQSQTQISLHNPTGISSLMNFARKYDEIREILFMIGTFVDIPNINKNISTWTTLYAITDTIFYYMANKYKAKDFDSQKGKKKVKDKILEMIGEDEVEYERFARTANNFDYLGIYARHGRQDFQTPKNPMTLYEGFNFVFNMVDKFFHYGASRNFVKEL